MDYIKCLANYIFWSLPYEMRRFLFRNFKRKHYQRIQNLIIGPDSDGYDLSQFIRTKSIFIHIPKSAGISFNKSFYGNYGGGHIPIRNYQLYISKNQFNSFLKYTIVRHPYDRLYSAYNFLKKGGLNDKDKLFAQKYILPYSTFEVFVMQWLTKDHIKLGIHFMPQTFFICDHKSRIIMDYIGYYEDIKKEFDKISQIIDPICPLKRLNPTDKSKTNYEDYYTEEMKRIVYLVYKHDFDLLKYKR